MRSSLTVFVAVPLFCLSAAGQTPAPVQSAALHLTLNRPAASVISAMFGALPKDVSLLEVTACNDTASPLLLSRGRVVQTLRRSGIEALSRDAAISTMQNAENRTWKSFLLRNSTHGLNVINFLVISKAVTLGPVLSNTLPGIQALLQAVVPELAREVPDHQYLNFDRGALAEHIQLSPLDCASGLIFAAKLQNEATPELVLEVPAIGTGPFLAAQIPLANPGQTSPKQ